MGRRDRRYLERAERALYEALASGSDLQLAAATARLNALEPRDEEDRRMRARLLAMAHTRVKRSPGGMDTAGATGRSETVWMFEETPPR